MSGNNTVTKHDDEEGLETETKTNPLPFIIVAVIIVGLAILAATMTLGHHSETANQPAPTVQAASAQIQPTSCQAFSSEHRTCSFGTAGTAGMGAEVGGHPCVDQAYGPNQTYRFQYWDETSQSWKDFGVGNDPAAASTLRFMANPGFGTVSVTYWKTEGSCATSNDAQDQSDQTTSTDDIEIVP